MSKWAGSLSPCKWCSIQDFQILATRIIMVKLKHLKENPSSPLPGHYYGSPILPVHYRHCTHSNEPMENEHAHKHNIVLSGVWGEGLMILHMIQQAQLIKTPTGKHNTKPILLFWLVPFHIIYDWDHRAGVCSAHYIKPCKKSIEYVT